MNIHVMKYVISQFQNLANQTHQNSKDTWRLQGVNESQSPIDQSPHTQTLDSVNRKRNSKELQSPRSLHSLTMYDENTLNHINYTRKFDMICFLAWMGRHYVITQRNSLQTRVKIYILRDCVWSQPWLHFNILVCDFAIGCTDILYRQDYIMPRFSTIPDLILVYIWMINNLSFHFNW